MKRKTITQVVFGSLALLAVTLALIGPADACTRIVYLGPQGTYITARSMDWAEDIKSNLWVFPRGMKRDGAAGPNSIRWASKYGSVITSGYDVGTADGMNELGLVVNLLYLAEADYGKPDGKRPLLSIGGWAQYVLDNYATVAETVKALQKEPYILIAPTLPNGVAASLHMAISDSSGDSAILEHVGGKLIIHHDRKYQVMTNSPLYDEQLALNKYWEQIGGLTMLPGTNRAADRFVRASFYVKAIPQTSEMKDALASVIGIIRGVSVPLGITTPDQPNISSTRWRTIADHKNKVYYFDSATSPMVFWVPLGKLDLKEGAPPRRLTLTGGKSYSGNVASHFEPTKPFVFLSTEEKK
jgi:penicillin V acylase-like amidase (Ntn superfamily)